MKYRTAFSVWYFGEDKSLYPMVMIERNGKKKYHYQVTKTSLKRLRDCIVTYNNLVHVGYNGWSVEYV